jgi:hypothetical protein
VRSDVAGATGHQPPHRPSTALQFRTMRLTMPHRSAGR